MENILFLLIGGVALAINVFINYNKERAKNAKRNIQPPKKVVSQPRVEIPSTPPFLSKYEKSVPETTTPSPPKKKFLNTLEGQSSMQTETLLLIKKYQSEENGEDIYNIFGEEDVTPITDALEIGDETPLPKNKNRKISLKTKEDFRKAIIYSTILERKY